MILNQGSKALSPFFNFMSDIFHKHPLSDGRSVWIQRCKVPGVRKLFWSVVLCKRRGEILLLLNGNKDPEGCVRKFASGQWQAGNVAKVLQNKTTQAWLASREQPQQTAA